MRNINLHVLLASGRLEPFLPTIREIETNYIPLVCRELNLSDVDIVVCDDANRAIQETGVGGWANHAHLLMVYINPASNSLRERLSNELKSTLAHELNHVARWRHVGYKYTLLESMISEGLADHFDVSFNNGTPRPWDTALDKEQLARYLEEAKSVWNDNQYDHAAWFFGSGQIPRWTGYALGFKLVGDYMHRTNEQDVKALVGLSAEKFVQ